MPFTWLVILLCYSLYTPNAQRKKKAIWACLGLLLFFNNSYLINHILVWWEPEPIRYEKLTKAYDLGIVLTGVTIYKQPNDRVFFHKGADRATHALQLYRQGHIKKILITGGKPGIISYGEAEANKLKQFFVMAGVPEKDILVEDKAKNTYENAQFTAELIKDKLEYKNLLLITSAFHMPRSIACFAKAGLKFDTFPVDYYGHDPVWGDLMPSADMKAFQLWSLLIHEWIGIVSYKVLGKS